MSDGRPGRHESGEPSELSERTGFWAEFRDSVAPRTVLLIVGVLVLQLGFILSYVGAFHAPKPHRIPIVVVAPDQVVGQTVARLNALPGSPLRARPVGDRATAERLLRQDETSAVFLVSAQAGTDTLLTTGAGGASVATAVQEVITRVDQSQQRTVTVTDLVPVQPGDARGLTGFYLVIGWIVGGYLVASLLGVAKGSRPANLRRAVFRLAAIVPYAILSGLGGALVVGQGLEAVTGHLVALWWLGALLVAASATVTMAFQVLFGVLGIGVTVLVFVVLGNPTAGGAYQTPVLPPFWRALSGALPNGAGTDTVRRLVYFGGHGIATHLVVIVIYLVAGALVAVSGSALAGRRTRPGSTDQLPGI